MSGSNLNLKTIESRLERQIRRLDMRRAILQATNRRFSWYRLEVILGGGVATWVAATYLGTRWGWWAFLGAVGSFFIMVAFHRRLDSWIGRFDIWREIRAEQLARLKLDWEKIAEPSLGEKWKRTALDVDLDLTGPRSLHHLLRLFISANDWWES